MKYQPLISQQVRLDFYREFTKRIQPLLDLYEYTYYKWLLDIGKDLELPPTIDFSEIETTEISMVLNNIRRILVAKIKNEVVKDWVLGEINDLRIQSKRWETIPTIRNRKDFTNRIANLIEEVGTEVDIFVTGRLTGDALKAKRFRKASGDQLEIERIKKKDPDLYASIKGSREKLRKIDAAMSAMISAGDMKEERMVYKGRIAKVGIDKLGNKIAYRSNGDVLGVDDFVKKIDEEDEALRRLQKFEKKTPSFRDLKLLTDEDLDRIRDGYARKTDVVFIPDLKGLRQVNDNALELLEGEVEYLSLTDNKVGNLGMVRIYPTKKDSKGRPVVISGRFKGIYVDDLVNQAGRLIEGTAYDFNPKTGMKVPIEGKDREGKPVINIHKEPYVTMTSEGKLMIKIPRNTAHTPMRQAVKGLLGQSATLAYEENTSGTTYTFEPRDFTLLRDAIGGFAMSKSATTEIEEYYVNLAKISAAQTPEISKLYTAEKIGGFKENFDFREVQKQSLAWAEARGWSGMIALAVGLGKTTVTVGAMQKMYRDGLAGDSGRFLYVCPNQLKGNLPRELKFASEDADSLIEKTDIMSYEQFVRSSNRNPRFADDYVAIFFDECQELRTNSRLKAVSKINNPRKIFMSASPMSKDPDEVFINVALTNNIKMFDDNGKMNRDFINRRRKWKARYAEVVGGRVMGITQDPGLRKEFHEWVGSNVFFRSPQDAPEINLPELRSQQEALSMDPSVEVEYRKAAKKVTSVIKSIVKKYEQGIAKGLDPKVDSFKGGAVGKAFRELQILQDMPDEVIPGARNPKLERSVEILREQVSKGGRSLMFTDSSKFAVYMGKKVSEQFPSKWVAVALPNNIAVYSGGKKVEDFREKDTFKDKSGKRVPKANWRSHVLSDMLQEDPRVVALILTAKYAVGQNLQSFSSIIHLDRDTWSGEAMKQRTGRAWRQGQKNPVEEFTLDVVYDDPKGTLDPTLDEARAAVHSMENRLFDEIIVESQGVELGTAYMEMKRRDASMVEIDRKMLNATISPYATRITNEDEA